MCFSRISRLLVSYIVYTIMIVNIAYGAENAIVAIVDDQPITYFDVERRAHLMMKLGGFQDNADVRAAVKQQSLYALIEGKLILPVAIAAGVKVNDKDLDEAEEAFAAQNGLSRAQLKSSLVSSGVNIQELREFFREQISWTRVMEKEIKPYVHVSDEEVEQNEKAVAEILNNNEESVRVKLAEIVLYADADNSVKTVQSLEKLLQQLEVNVDFSKLVQEFSESDSRKDNGVIGWVHIEQMAQDLKDAVKHLEKGQVSKPVILGDRVVVLKVLDRQVLKKGIDKKDDKKRWIVAHLYQHKLHLKTKMYLNALRRSVPVVIKGI